MDDLLSKLDAQLEREPEHRDKSVSKVMVGGKDGPVSINCIRMMVEIMKAQQKAIEDLQRK